MKRLSKMRKFLDQYAKSKKFNPLDVEEWYSVTKNDIVRSVRVILHFELLLLCSDEFYRMEALWSVITTGHILEH
jgi:hypothetical protein